MSFVQNVPAFSILIAMFTAILTFAMNGKNARRLSIGLCVLLTLMNSALLAFLVKNPVTYTYMMGHYPAPWGNELRAGMLEAALAVLFCLIVLFSLLGRRGEAKGGLFTSKANLYYIMLNMVLASNLALVYTNDMFTAYVFVEINTIGACGLILGHLRDRSIAAGVRYMLMSLMGSGLLLLGISFLYGMTGHLLMSNIKASVLQLVENGDYWMPLVVTVGLITVGLAIKSALWPFHAWLPSAYGNSLTTSATILSSVIAKGYIFLLIKIIFRVIGENVYAETDITTILFVFGIIGMVAGSLQAIRQKNIRRMIAYSSIAQIGYIFMGIGMNTIPGMEASVYHIFAHSTAKALAFVAAYGLIRANGGSAKIEDLAGAGFRDPVAGLGFFCASLSMVGIPGFGGFVSKFKFATASLVDVKLAVPVLLALALSTLLNAIYFMRASVHIYTPLSKVKEPQIKGTKASSSTAYCAAILGLLALNLFLGVAPGWVGSLIEHGMAILG